MSFDIMLCTQVFRYRNLLGKQLTSLRNFIGKYFINDMFQNDQNVNIMLFQENSQLGTYLTKCTRGTTQSNSNCQYWSRSVLLRNYRSASWYFALIYAWELQLGDVITHFFWKRWRSKATGHYYSLQDDIMID